MTCYLVLKEQVLRSGDNGEVVTPGPISNPEVKHFIGEHSHFGESSTLPVKDLYESRGFFMENELYAKVRFIFVKISL